MSEMPAHARASVPPSRAPMAVTGMAGLFPGANDVDAYWTRILSAQPAPLDSQQQRWGLPRERYLGTVEQADRAYADAAFNINVPEGGAHDPQVRAGRWAVEAALADAARQGTVLARQEIALVAATSWSAPSYFGHDASQLCGLPAPAGPAHSPQVQLAALAQGLGGPLLAVDTACASSLYGLELAAGLLESGQAKAVVVLGLNVLMPPFLFVGFSKLMALSPQSRIAPFASDASGIVPGECAAALVLEPLAAARAAGRRVAGIVRGVGLAADGAERSIFAPGPDGQRRAYERAYEGLDRLAVDYVEAHGTATTVGDETEIQSLQSFFGPGRDRPLPIGSVKGLIGHTLAAAGIASVIKGLKMLAARTVPPHLDVTPHTGLAGTLLQLPTAPQPLGDLGRPMRVGISGFGFGGANAHVVLDEAVDLPQSAPASHPQCAQAESGCEAEPLALVDFEAAFGPRIGLAALVHAMRQDQGWSGCFPDTLQLDAHGLRMGPKFLGRLDPLQLLTTHLARDLLARHPGLMGSPDVSIVMASNLGGAMSLRLSRKYARLFAGQAAPDAPDTTIEAIASALPTMCSGYPAYHLNLRGFHQTLSGDGGCFWTALRLAAGWLRRPGQALLLGGAHMRKSPVDAQAAAPSGSEPQEAAALFLLKTLAQARAAGDRVLAVIRPVAVARPGEALSQAAACAQVGVAPESVDLRLSTELANAQLEEAAGVELLSQVLLRDGRRAAVEVRQDGRCAMVFFIDKEASLDSRAAQARPAGLPLAVPIDPEGRQLLPQSRGATVPAGDVITPAAWPVAFDKGEQAVLHWARQASRALAGYFQAQQRALALLHGPSSAETAAIGGRAGDVLCQCQLRALERRAQLRVDESDPYFFDHPLDHVPGILMAEGIVQLACLDAPGHWVRWLSLKFRRFCEKTAAVEIVLPASAEQLAQVEGVCEGQVLQQGQAVGSFEVALGRPQLLRRGRAPAVVPVAQRELLHKRHAANVLVGPLAHGAQGPCVALVPPPPEHRFARGAELFHAPLYLLETARQAVMLGAHVTLGIPLGLPMNLLGVTLSLRAPAPRSAALRYRLEAQPLRQLDAMTLADVRAVLIDDTQGDAREIGEVRIRAQVVDEVTYARQRQAVRAGGEPLAESNTLTGSLP